VREAAQTLRALHGMLVEKVGGERALDVRPLASVLSPLVNVCNNALSTTAPAETLAADEGGGAPAAGAAPSVSGEVRTREDAIRLLDKVCDFLERQEPSNPAPLLIRRAKRLMTMSFVDIINDMAPESLVQVRNIAGIRDE
jgi:type VI secretion system protein ImpA